MVSPDNRPKETRQTFEGLAGLARTHRPNAAIQTFSRAGAELA
jgi:hypothetical protein